MTFKGFNDSKRLLDQSQYFNILKGKKVSAMLPRSWKKIFKNVIVLPTKMRRCNECKDGIVCTKCHKQINENEEFETILNKLERHSPNEFGHMLPYYVI